MAIIRTTRFEVVPARIEEMLARRSELIAEIRETFAGLTEARLGRIDDTHWIDAWRWSSADDLRAALERAPALPAAGPAFAVVSNVGVEQAELVDER